MFVNPSLVSGSVKVKLIFEAERKHEIRGKKKVRRNKMKALLLVHCIKKVKVTEIIF